MHLLCRYILSNYECAYLVFHGYNSGPTTKHVGIAPIVQFTTDVLTEEGWVPLQQGQRFINMLASELELHGCTVQHATADADILIVGTILGQGTKQDTVLIGDDTDLLVLLCSLANDTISKVFFKSEARSGSRKPVRCWDIFCPYLQQVVLLQVRSYDL